MDHNKRRSMRVIAEEKAGHRQYGEACFPKLLQQVAAACLLVVVITTAGGLGRIAEAETLADHGFMRPSAASASWERPADDNKAQTPRDITASDVAQVANAPAIRARSQQLNREDKTTGERLSAAAAGLVSFLTEVVRKVPSIPYAINSAWRTFDAERGDRPWLSFAGWLLACIACGSAAAFSLYRVRPRRRGAMNDRSAFPDLQAAAGRAGIDFIALLAFVALSILMNAIVNRDVAPDRWTTASILSAIGWTAFTSIVARFLFTPARPGPGLVDVPDSDASWLVRRITLIALVFNLGFGFAAWLDRFGSSYLDSRYGFWINLAFHLLLASTLWQGRHIMRDLLRSASQDRAAWHFAALWPAIAIVAVAIHGLAIEIVLAQMKASRGLLPAMAITLTIVVALPFMDLALRRFSAAFFQSTSPSSTDAVSAVDRASRRAFVRVGRVVGLVLLAIVLFTAWRTNPFAAAEIGLGLRFAVAMLDGVLIIAVGYAILESTQIFIDRQIAKESGLHGGERAMARPSEGEGGGEGARLGTVLPLVKIALRAFIGLVVILGVLQGFGVDVLPLLAGAGVVGLAIGFGSQTLVKDIISGMFFLIDDAFRLGEYVDVGNVKGTVERISVRSMQLRHHRGVLNTVPFGEIRHVANYSRDWVVMKFPLRLPYDTDAEKVRKLIKKLGEKLLDDPEHGAQFLQPLKCQGVVQMEDSAMIMPVKFMARPGDQWMLRRLVLNHIHRLFEENGIRFASREVVVRLAEEPMGEAVSEKDRRAIAASAGRMIADEEAERLVR